MFYSYQPPKTYSQFVNDHNQYVKNNNDMKKYVVITLDAYEPMVQEYKQDLSKSAVITIILRNKSNPMIVMDSDMNVFDISRNDYTYDELEKLL